MPGDSPHYPTNIPDLTDMREVVDDVDDVIATDHNDPIKEIIAMATELGELPKGVFDNVKDRLDEQGYTNSCRAYRGTSVQSITKNTPTKVEINAISYDPKSCFDITTNHRFTAPKAGYYLVNAAVRYVSPEANTTYQARIYRQGSAYADNTIHTSNINPISIPISDVVYLAIDQYIELYTYHTSSVTENITGSSPNTYITITWLHQ